MNFFKYITKIKKINRHFFEWRLMIGKGINQYFPAGMTFITNSFSLLIFFTGGNRFFKQFQFM